MSDPKVARLAGELQFCAEVTRKTTHNGTKRQLGEPTND
jgi:hypothetical protein